MTDDNHLLSQREALFDGIEFMPQDRGGIRIRVSARVAVKPELVIAPDVLIATQAVEHRRPGRRRIHQPVDDEHDGFVRVVGLKSRDACGLRVFGRIQADGRVRISFGSVLASITASGTVKSAASG